MSDMVSYTPADACTIAALDAVVGRNPLLAAAVTLWVEPPSHLTLKEAVRRRLHERGVWREGLEALLGLRPAPEFTVSSGVPEKVRSKRSNLVNFAARSRP